MDVYRCECVKNFQCRETCVEGARKFGSGINFGLVPLLFTYIFCGACVRMQQWARSHARMWCFFDVPLVHALTKAESIVEGNALVAGTNHEPVLVRYIFYVADDSRANIFLRY